MRRLAPLAAVLLIALAVPATAAAHATLAGAYPETQSRLEAAPKEVRLAFTQVVTAGSSAILVLAADGRVVSGEAHVSDDGRIVVAPVSGLRRGEAYTVRWRVTGPDGHSPAGVYTFGIGVAAPPPTEAVGAGATTWKDDAARWLLFATLALVIGPLAIRLLVVRGPVPDRLERRFHVVATVAAFAVVDVGIAAFVLRAANALQLPVVDLLYGDLTPFAEKTRFGIAFLAMTLGFAVVAALLMLAWIFDWLALRWPALVLAAVLVSGLSLSGHQGTEPNSSSLSELADWIHLLAACVWVGGVATLALVVWPAAPELRRRAFVGFSRLAVGLVAAMVLAGVYIAVVRLPSVSDLWETEYGNVLLLKVAIVAVALAWGGVHHTFVRPRLEAGGQPRVRASLIGESAVALAVLLAAAVLTNVAPPDAGSASTPAVQSGR
jgi:copper transport protein